MDRSVLVGFTNDRHAKSKTEGLYNAPGPCVVFQQMAKVNRNYLSTFVSSLKTEEVCSLGTR